MSSADQGVKLWGPHREQRQVFVLSISHADSIMGALYDRYRHLPDVKWVAVIQDWADMAGWWESEGDYAIAPHDTERFIEGLASLQAEEFDSDYSLASDLMDSVHGLHSFIHQHWIKGEIVYIENL